MICFRKTCLETRTVPSNIYIYIYTHPFVILLETLSCFFLFLMWCMFLVVVSLSPVSFFFFSFKNYNLTILVCWHFNFSSYFFYLDFLSCFFCKSFIGFQFHHAIQIEGIMIFNLVLIALISNFFSWPIYESYYSFQCHLLINTLVLFLC
jgi:hypothetical protein